MRFRDAARRSTQEAPRPYVPGRVLEAGFIPAPRRADVKAMERQLVEGPPAPDEGEIDPKTGVAACMGKDVCTLEVCSMGIRAHGVRTAAEPVYRFPPGSTGNGTVDVYEGADRITARIRHALAGAEEAQAAYDAQQAAQQGVTDRSAQIDATYALANAIGSVDAQATAQTQQQLAEMDQRLRERGL